ncbi:TonB-dependent receptor [Fibrobacter sp. UWB12]|uniref:TonB-dependent receptor n=1 Tax=Fibrobacter sp. UWB12 TaxID=1896203 RepID=UPI000919DF10|nr:TonB-dependent receptor plug domain-containing protein [Fibrobacter sp. UWB12]SHK48172.1 Outer membrane receptor for ferrienterochelin and colicins [Fibrobacter sp. UWB12]
MNKKIAFSVALCSACVFAQTDEVTSYDDAFFDESAAVSESPAPTATNSENVAETPSRNSSKSSDITVLDGLSVEDESEAETSPVDTKTKAESVKVLDTKELQGSSATIAEATNRSSGVKIRQSGGLGGESKINIRGMEGKNVKVLVDGVPVDNGNGSLSINDIPIDKVDRIEVYKSYVPERFATDGMGGVINIVTHNLPESSITGSYSFGSFNTHKASLDAKYVWAVDSANQRSVETGISAYYNYSDNDYEFTTPYMDTTVTREHDRYYSYSISPFVNLNNFWFDRISLGASFGGMNKEIQSTAHRVEDAFAEAWGYGVSLGLEKKDLFVKGLSAGLSVGFNYSKDRVVDTSHVYYYGWDKTNFKESKGVSGEISMGSATFIERENYTLTMPWNVDYAFNENHSLTWSGLYRYESQDPVDKLAAKGQLLNNAGFPGYSHSVVTGISLENNFWDKRIQNVAGIKAYYYSIKADDVDGKLKRLTDDDATNKDIGYSENIRVKIIEPLALKGGYQHSLRFPTREEIFGDGVYVQCAPNLKPEKSDNFTAGAELDLDNIPLLLHLHLEFNWFYLLMEDRIYWNNYASIPRPYYNSVGTITSGFEIDASIDVNEYVALSFNLTKQDAESREADMSFGIAKELTVPNIPTLYMNFGVEFHLGDILFKDDFFKLYWLANYTDDYYYGWKVSAKQDRTIPSSFSQDIGVEYSIMANKLSWSFEVKNFTDELVYDKYGESKPGRAFATKAKFSL